MLEMGPDGPEHHAALAGDIEAARANTVYLNGPQMKSLWDRLPVSRRGAYAETSAENASLVAAALQDGDVVLVKGSLGSRMAAIVEALKARGIVS
jgi:UDP-N-acetylmuramoyl-tripeptide--D-alanyl-D-alanine ligase